MVGRGIVATMMLALAGGAASAGTLHGGTWQPTGCGAEPVAPTINQSSVPAYQDSVKAAQAYQQAAKTYSDCVFKEADADNHAIADAVHDEQAAINAHFEKMNADSKAASDRFNKKKP